VLKSDNTGSVGRLLQIELPVADRHGCLITYVYVDVLYAEDAYLQSNRILNGPNICISELCSTVIMFISTSSEPGVPQVWPLYRGLRPTSRVRSCIEFAGCCCIPSSLDAVPRRLQVPAAEHKLHELACCF
jgi:hypothetical protein